MLNPAGPVAQDQLGLIDSSIWVMTLVFVVVAGALLVILLRFRWRGQTELPPQWEGSTRLELLWTIVPFILLALLAVGTVRDSFVLAAPEGKNVLKVNVVGHQYWWSFSYPGTNIVTANELHIPVGQKVELVLTSADVIHAFWIPRLGGKTALVPGRTNIMWIEADQPGTYKGQCAEFCGTGHADMRLLVVAEPPAKFAQWEQQMEHPVVQPTSALAQQGEKYFASEQCSSCHTIGGTSFVGVVGPNLTNLAQRQMIAGNLLPNDAQDLAAWLKDPQAVKPGSLMPNLHLSPDKIKALVAFLQSLKTPAPSGSV
ncbi:MAG: cytochrome c oxidase subunit II [Firmicutes bacterium]|nr:cytochrome c oxidase subunit II [Bacillota bacterium]